MKPRPIRLRFCSYRGWHSRLVEWFTWSDYSHVDLVLPSGNLLGALPGGVAVRAPDQPVRQALFEVQACDEVLALAVGQIGKPYDWAGVFGIALRHKLGVWREDDSWWCSELIAWCFERAGFPLLRGDDFSSITPRDLLLSPHLRPVHD